MNKETCGLNHNSFIPMLNESERFLGFLLKKFEVKVEAYVITINKAHKDNFGHFRPKDSKESFENEKGKLHNINLNTIHIKDNCPYKTLAHELAHLINNVQGIKDCSSNQYHNKKFKLQAEKLLLKCEGGFRGYAQTKKTEEFNKMLIEFKPNKEVWNIAQLFKDKNPSKTKMKKWVCGCGVIVRCAIELNACCNECNTNFENEI